MEDIEHHNIPIYNFPYDPEEDDEETIEENSELRSLLPFALIGCEEEIIVNGRKVRGRQYPWGIVEVDNTQHCDFAKLRFALLRYVNTLTIIEEANESRLLRVREESSGLSPTVFCICSSVYELNGKDGCRASFFVPKERCIEQEKPQVPHKGS